MTSATTKIEVTRPKLHEKQRQIVRERARFNVIECGRRFGKTWLILWLTVTTLILGQRCAWIAPKYTHLDDLWDEIEKRLQPLVDIGAAKVNKSKRRIKLANGGLLECWGLDRGTPPRGRKYHRVLFDEAAHGEDLASFFRAVIRATLGDYKGDCWFMSTPFGRGDFWQFAERGRSGLEEDAKWMSWRFTTYDNPYMDHDEIEDMKLDIGVDLIIQQEIYAIAQDDATNPFGIASIHAATIDEATNRAVVAWGMDVAQSNDHTVLFGLDRFGMPAQIHRFESGGRLTYPQIIDKAESIMRDAAMGGYPAPVMCDATGVGKPVCDELEARGLKVVDFKFTATSKRQLTEGYIADVQAGRAWIVRGVHLSECESFTYKYTIGKGVSYSHRPGGHDDVLYAGALAGELGRQLNLPWPEEHEMSDRIAQCVLPSGAGFTRGGF